MLADAPRLQEKVPTLANYSHKEKPCTDVVCVWDHPDISMLVQILRGDD